MWTAREEASDLFLWDPEAPLPIVLAFLRGDRWYGVLFYQDNVEFTTA